MGFDNETGGDNGGIATSTFKVGLPIDFELRASLALKPVTDMHKLMERVEEYKRLEMISYRIMLKPRHLLGRRKRLGKTIPLGRDETSSPKFKTRGPRC